MRSMTDEGGRAVGVLQLLDGGTAITRLASPATLSRDAGEGRTCLNSAAR